MLSLADSFLHSLARLSPSDVKRAASFLDKLVHQQEAAGLRPRRVHDAADPRIHSFNVTHDLRAIGHVEGDDLVLLWVARHDDAYVWARNHCMECDERTGAVGVVPATPASAARS